MAAVNANDREVACKARPGSGKAFPDVCFNLPPPPPPTGTPIPYLNIVKHAKLKLGTFTLFITRKLAAVFPTVYFSKSTGDTPCTSPKKGIISSFKESTGRFVSFSPNVLFECRPVCRDKDLTTQNHTSISPVPPNTPPTVYMTGKDDCCGKCSK